LQSESGQHMVRCNMTEPGWLSLLPPLLAIVMALWTQQVYPSLFAGIWLGWTILDAGNPLTGLRDAVQACIDVFKDEGNTRVIAFSAAVGALLAFTQRSGGVDGFIHWVTTRRHVRSARGAQLLAAALGCGIFVESNITCLVTGAVARPLFDRYRLSREKLAYVCDSTSAPVCMLIPMNGWGAYVIALLANQHVENPVSVLVSTIPLNFYSLAAVIYVLFIAASGKDWGPMARAERRARDTGKLIRDGGKPLVSTDVLNLSSKPGATPRARNMLVPLGVMVAMIPIGLAITGNGSFMAGSGSTSVLWAVLAAIAVAAAMYSWECLFTFGELMELFFQGVGGLMPLALLMMFAFAIGATCGELQTGIYSAGVAKGLLSAPWVPVTLFLLSGFIAFSTGTSWGTFAIMLPIAVPLAGSLGAHLPLSVAAVLSGGVFGDHCSPISDTTIISSMAAGSDHIDHVKTQLPYALAMAAPSALVFFVLGWLL
jgi:tetracycline resistance efflux pump